MEEKERYTLVEEDFAYAIVDNEEHKTYQQDCFDFGNICDLLNQQSKRIKELENMNSRLSQGIYWGNGEHFCDVVKKYKAENKQLKEELKKYKSYKTDDERIKNLTDLYEKYTTENQQLKQQLAEKERQYETLYKLFSEQHEIIDQNELGCFEEVNRLLKEQKDFYIVEKTEYDKMKQGAKDIVKELKQQLAEKEKELKKIKNLRATPKQLQRAYQERYKYKERCNELKNQHLKDKISFAVEQLEKVNGALTEAIFEVAANEFDTNKLCYLEEKFYEKIDQQINELKGEKV